MCNRPAPTHLRVEPFHLDQLREIAAANDLTPTEALHFAIDLAHRRAVAVIEARRAIA